MRKQSTLRAIQLTRCRSRQGRSFGEKRSHLVLLGFDAAQNLVLFMNSLTTFARESGRELRLTSYFNFALSQVAGLVANTATVFVASYFMPVLIGKVLAIGASFLVNFSLSHFVVFRKRPESDVR